MVERGFCKGSIACRNTRILRMLSEVIRFKISMKRVFLEIEKEDIMIIVKLI